MEVNEGGVGGGGGKEAIHVAVISQGGKAEILVCVLC